MERLVSGELSIDPRPSPADGTIVLEWRGRSTDRQPARTIIPFVTPCLERALHLKVPLRMHFENLEHMNSSTITAVIQIIQEARSRGTRLVLVYSPEKRWQKLGFEALRVFVKEDGLLEALADRGPRAIATEGDGDRFVTANGFGFNIDVPVRTEWRNVTLLVTSVQNCFNAMFANVDGSQTIAMVTGELLENAIKYGAWATADQAFRLNVIGKDGAARVIVENPANELNASELMAALKWITKFATPDEAYKAKLLEIAQTPPSREVSHLGLVRIAYEASCTINATYETGIVRVIADVKI